MEIPLATDEFGLAVLYPLLEFSASLVAGRIMLALLCMPPEERASEGEGTFQIALTLSQVEQLRDAFTRLAATLKREPGSESVLN